MKYVRLFFKDAFENGVISWLVRLDPGLVDDLIVSYVYGECETLLLLSVQFLREKL